MADMDYTSPLLQNSSSGTTSAEEQMAGELGGGLLEGAGIAFTGYMQKKANEEARAENRKLAMIQRGDVLQKQKKENEIKRIQLEQSEKAFDIEKYIKEQDLRHDMFLNDLQRHSEAKAQLVNSVKSLSSSVSKNSELRDIILSSFRRS